eukprot:750636-Hanusia_phi.AAC.8
MVGVGLDLIGPPGGPGTPRRRTLNVAEPRSLRPLSPARRRHSGSGPGRIGGPGPGGARASDSSTLQPLCHANNYTGSRATQCKSDRSESERPSGRPRAGHQGDTVRSHTDSGPSRGHRTVLRPRRAPAPGPGPASGLGLRSGFSVIKSVCM